MDIGGLNQSEAPISLRSRFALRAKSIIKCSPSFIIKGPGNEGGQISDPSIYLTRESNFWFLCAPLGIVNM